MTVSCPGRSAFHRRERNAEVEECENLRVLPETTLPLHLLSLSSDVRVLMSEMSQTCQQPYKYLSMEEVLYICDIRCFFVLFACVFFLYRIKEKQTKSEPKWELKTGKPN